jgi:hypothetical protein
MAGVNYVDQQTRIRTDWLQGVNDLFYDVFQSPTEIEDIRIILPEATQQFKGLMSADDLIKLNDIDSPFGIRNFEIEEVASSRTLVIEDKYKYLRTTSASLVEITVPTNASVPFEIGEFVYIEKAGNGNVLFSPSPGVTLTTPGALGIADLYFITGLIKVDTDEWLVVNNSTPFATTAGNLAMGTAVAPYLHTFDKDTLVKIDDPLEPPTGPVERVRFSDDGQFLAVLSTTDNLIVYDTSTYQRVELASQPPLTEGRGLAFTHAGDLLMARNMTYNTSDWSVADSQMLTLTITPVEVIEDIEVKSDDSQAGCAVSFPNNPANSVGRRIYRPPTLDEFIGPGGLNGDGNAVAYNPADTFFVLCKTDNVFQPPMTIQNATTYAFNSGQVSSQPSEDVRGTKFTSDGDEIVVADSVAPRLKLYFGQNAPPGLGARLTDPTIQPTGRPNDVYADHNDQKVYVAHDDFPYMTIYSESNFNVALPLPPDMPQVNIETVATPSTPGGAP